MEEEICVTIPFLQFFTGILVGLTLALITLPLTLAEAHRRR